MGLNVSRHLILTFPVFVLLSGLDVSLRRPGLAAARSGPRHGRPPADLIGGPRWEFFSVVC